MISQKKKIILDGTVLGMAIDNKLARTGIYFVIKNLCDNLIIRNDLELKILTPIELRKKMISYYSNHQFKECLNLTNIKFGKEKLNFIMPYHPASHDLYNIPESNIFQIVFEHFSKHLVHLRIWLRKVKKNLTQSSPRNPRSFQTKVLA